MDVRDSLDGGAIAGINIVPLVDVCLVLVLIFMVTSNMLSKNLIAVVVPKAVTSRAEDRENITVSISPKDGFAINEKTVTRGNLVPGLAAQMKSSSIRYILIRADERTPHKEVEYVMKVSRRLGASRIAFATEPKQ